MEAFMGTIMAVGFNFAPRGWAFCNGQLLSIAQNSALFALLGTTYGGDGVQTFALPDLRGRTAVGSQGNGPGVQPVAQGELAGSNNVTVIGNGAVTVTIGVNNLPAHTHPATMNLTGVTAATNVAVGTATTGGGLVAAAGGALTSTAAGGPAAAAVYLPANTAGTNPVNLGGVSTTLTGNGTVDVQANTGGGQALNAPVTTSAQCSIMQPYLGLNYIIALQGIFPSRN